MIHFALICGSPSRVAACAHRLRAAIHATAVLPGTASLEFATDRTWAFAALSETDSVLTDRVLHRGNRLIAVNGAAFARTGDQAGTLAHLLHHYERQGAGGVASALSGNWNFVGITSRRGLTAFGDPFEMMPLYWGETSRCVVVSNRSSTVAEIIGSPQWDARSLAGIVRQGGLWGDEMAKRGVRLIAPGQQATSMSGTGVLSLDRSPVWIWPEGDEGRPNLDPSEWDAVTDSLVDNVRNMATQSDRLEIELTGDKDSRLHLAVARAAGLADRIETVTTASPDSAEFRIAATVASAAGVSHRSSTATDPTDGLDPGGFGVSSPNESGRGAAMWYRLRTGIHRYEGAIGAHRALAVSTAPRSLYIGAAVGEIYRGGPTRPRRINSGTLDELLHSLPSLLQIPDPLGVIAPRERERQDRWIREWAREQARSLRLDLVSEKAIIDHGALRWNGVILQSRPRRIEATPLLSPFAASKCFELDRDARTAERFHFEVMCRAAPELVALPFHLDAWSTRVHPDVEEDLSRSTVGSRVDDIRTGEQWPATGGGARISQFFETEATEIEQRFRRAGRTTAFGEVFDVDRLSEISRDPESLRTRPAIEEYLDCIGAALTLLGESFPVRESDHGSSTPA